MKYIGIIGFILLVSTSFVFANGFGITLDKAVGDYVANVDYDAVNGIAPGYPVQFAIQLFNKDRSQPIDFSDVWVTITPSDSSNAGYVPPIFDGGLIGSTFPPTGMTLIFQKSGSYEMKLRYDKDQKTLVETSFPLKVEGTSGSITVVNVKGPDFFKDFSYGVITTLILIFGGRFIVKFFKKKEGLV